MYSQRDRREIDQLVISRQVFDGEKLTASAEYFGREIFGEDMAGFIGVHSDTMSEEHGIGVNELVGLGAPRVKVVDPDDLVLHMFELWAPQEVNHSGRFRNAAFQLIRRAEKVFNPIPREGEEPGTPRYRTSGLYPMLDRIGAEHGIFFQTDVPIRCEGLTLPVAPHSDDRLHLSLALHPTDVATRMLVAQALACQKGLSDISKRVAYPAGVPQVHIPFCSLPSDATPEQSEKFVEALTQQIQDTQLRIGGVIPGVF